MFTAYIKCFCGKLIFTDGVKVYKTINDRRPIITGRCPSCNSDISKIKKHIADTGKAEKVTGSKSSEVSGKKSELEAFKKFFSERSYIKKDGVGISLDNKGNIYIGELRNKKRNGMGTEKLRGDDDLTIAGKWVDGKLMGMGMVRYPSGSILLGFFNDGTLNGPGIMIHANGRVMIGNWKNNKKHGLCTLFEKDGTVIYSTQYKEDEVVDIGKPAENDYPGEETAN